MNELKTVIYTPESALPSPRQLAGELLRSLFASRELAWRLAVRDISAQYRQTLLGLLWAIILPLANALAWIFLNGSGVVQIAGSGLPYPLFVFTGALLWAILMDAVNAPLQQAIAARPMLAKLNFPREALIVSGIYQTLFNALIKIALLAVILLVYGVNPGWGVLPFAVGLASLILVGTALGLLVTPVGLLYMDVGRVLPLLMQFLMFVTPVVYPVPAAGAARGLILANPLTPVILACRDWLTGATPEHLAYFVLVNLAALALLVVVWVVYRLAMPILIERMSA